MSNANKNNYYLGGLAELIPNPSILTYSFVRRWFCGKESVGRAMKILNLPCKKIDYPILVINDGNLVVDLSIEEKTLYSETIFKYLPQSDNVSLPKQTISVRKILNPTNIAGTLKILITQSKWIADQKKILEKFRKEIDGIKDEKTNDISEIDKKLREEIWPIVIAIGALAEFYHQVLEKERGEKKKIYEYIASEVSKNDWFFTSVSDQIKVRNRDLSFDEYINKYGLRADIDYELTLPRWHEIKDEIKKRINTAVENKQIEKQNQINIKIIDTNIQIQLLRSESKRKALFYIDLLRKALLTKAESQNIKDLENYEFDLEKQKFVRSVREDRQIIIQGNKIDAGRGIPVSSGKATGKSLLVKNNQVKVEQDIIGIFPNASPQFAPQFNKCSGIIFLTGGLTSHGAIVAREFGIPAIIDPKASGISSNSKIEINGATGEWKLI